MECFGAKSAIFGAKSGGLGVGYIYSASKL